MKWSVICIVAVILSQLPASALGTNEDLALQADAAYTMRNFEVAVDLYQQLLEQGVKQSEVFFNLGNAYYQLKDLGRSLINYRRAKALMPRDEDLRLNLARIRVQRLDTMPVEAGIAGQITNLTSDWLSLSELGWTVIALWWLFVGLFAAYLWCIDWRKWLKWAILASGALFVVLGLFAVTRATVDTTRKPAIIVYDTVSVMSGPGANYLEIYELHAAAEIRIVEERNHWVRFQLPDLREGWIDEHALEVI